MKRFYTLLEILTVITIIAILAGLIVPAVNRSKRRAKETQCVNNLRQIGLAMMSYKSEWDDTFPIWLTDLTVKSNYLPAKAIYTCMSDINRSEGRTGSNWRLNKPGNGGKQDEVLESGNSASSAPCIDIYDYPRTRTGHDSPPLKDGQCTVNASYLYEFNNAVEYPASWATGSGKPSWSRAGLTWQRYKMLMIRKGKGEDLGSGYTPGKFKNRLSFFPMVRCFWHIDSYSSPKDKPVFNVAVAGNVFYSVSEWEKTDGTWE